MVYYVISRKNGKVLSKSGMFTDEMSKAKAFKQKASAFQNAAVYAKYYRIETYVQDEEGNEVSE